MSPTKKLIAFSILPALFLISCALSSISTTDKMAEHKALRRDIASQKTKLLTYAQIQKMPAPKVYDYYMKLYALMGEIETFQFKYKNGMLNAPKKSAQMINFLEESFAQTLPEGSDKYNYSEGKGCLIGGYVGAWTKKAVTDATGNTVYRLTCDSPNRCTIPGSPVANTGHKCNSKFFLFNDSANPPTEYCADLKADLTKSNCRNVVEQSFRDKGKAGFAEQFKRSALASIERDAKYQGISKEAAALAFQQDVYSEYRKIYEYCGATEDEWNKHSAGQQYSCFPLMSQYSEIQTLLAEVVEAPEITTPEPLTPPLNIEPKEPKPRVPAESGADDGLGPYSCIKTGLNAGGYPGVSNRYIALFAVAAKYRADYYGGSTLLRKNKTIINTFNTMRDIGLCKNKYYSFEGGQAEQSSGLLNQDKFSRTSFAAEEYESLFALPWGAAMPHDMAWERATPSARKRSWQKSSPSPAHMCVSKSNYKIDDKACRAVMKACKIDVEQQCGPEKKSSGSNNGGNNNGNNNGSTTGGSDNGPDNSQGEVGEGSNAEAGHGGSSTSGMGDGPG